MKNGIEVDWTDNPDLADLLSRKRPGDKFELKIRGQVNEIDDEGMKGSIEKVLVSKDSVTVDSDEPVMVVMRGKSEEKGAEDEEESPAD